ncbi:MAG: hypothetical protein R2830_19205 [Saprospiraceae bacterium]
MTNFNTITAAAAGFTALWLAATFLPAMFIAGCQAGGLHQEDVQPDTTTMTVDAADTTATDGLCSPCNTISASICIDDNDNPFWASPWDMCLNLHTQISWEPALGHIVIRSSVPLCGSFFEWRWNTLCNVPEYQWHVDATYGPQQGQFWEGHLTFPPDECLAESYLQCCYFRFRMDCPPCAAAVHSQF